MADFCDGLYQTEKEFIDGIRYPDWTEVDQARSIRKHKLIFFDDIGVKYINADKAEWLHDVYWSLFDDGDFRQPIFCCASNFHPMELQARIGGRAVSRLLRIIPQEFWLDMRGIPDYSPKLHKAK